MFVKGATGFNQHDDHFANVMETLVPYTADSVVIMTVWGVPEDEACIGGEGDEDDRDSLQSGRSRGTNESNDGVRWRRPAARKPEYQNPLFHMPLLSDSQREAAQSSATAR